MFFQFSRFWQNYGFTSQLETLIEKPDCTIEQILDEENILAELKNSGSQKFAKFITKDPKLYDKLIDYIIQYTEERTDSRIQIKYPFLVSEVFSSENQGLIDFLFDKPAAEVKEEEEKPEKTATDGEEEAPTTEVEVPQVENAVPDPLELHRQRLLPRLLSFLEQDAICVTSAGYFNKTVLPIIKKRGYDVQIQQQSIKFWNYLVDHPQVISDLIKHIDVTHIADIVQKLIILDTQSEQQYAQQDCFIQHRQQLLGRLLNVIQMKSYNQLIVDNVANIFCEIIQQGSNPNVFHGKDLVSLIDVINKPLKIFEFGVQTQSPTVLQVLVQLLEWQRSKVSQKANKEDEDMTNYQDLDEESLYTCYHDLPKRIPSALKARYVYSNQFTTTYGEHLIPMTQTKLAVLTILHQLILQSRINNIYRTGDATLLEAISETHAFRVIQTLIVQHQFHNQLQIVFEKMVNLVFDNPKATALQERVQINNVIQQIIDDGLLEFILEHNDNQLHNAGAMKNAVKRGYQGVLTKLSNYLSKVPKPNTAMAKATDAWNSYVNTTLKAINETENSWLCGINPKSKGNQDDSNDHDQEVQSILNRFQQHRSDYSNTNTNNNDQPPEEEVQEDRGGDDEFQDVQDHENIENDDQHRKNSNSSSDEEVIQERINEAIISPRSAPQEISDLIQLQEKLVLNEMSPADIEKKTDAEVNQYWKHHSEEAKNDHAQIEPEKHHNEETKEDTTNPSTQSQPEEEIPPVQQIVEAVVAVVEQHSEEPVHVEEPVAVQQVEEQKEDQN